MSGWTKLFSSILSSTVWLEDNPTRLAWIGMLAYCDANGVVEGSIPGLANIFRITPQEMEIAINKFLSPDPHSRTSDYEGRRIEKVDGGWKILNRNKFRDLPQNISGSKAPKMRKYRERKKVTDGNALPLVVTGDTETETEIEKENISLKEINKSTLEIGPIDEKFPFDDVSSKSSEKNKLESDLKEAYRFFFVETERIWGFKPQAVKTDYIMLRRIIKKMPKDEIIDAIRFFLNSKKAKDFGITLSMALSAHSLNSWMQRRAHDKRNGNAEKSGTEKDGTEGGPRKVRSVGKTFTV